MAPKPKAEEGPNIDLAALDDTARGNLGFFYRDPAETNIILIDINGEIVSLDPLKLNVGDESQISGSRKRKRASSRDDGAINGTVLCQDDEDANLPDGHATKRIKSEVSQSVIKEEVDEDISFLGMTVDEMIDSLKKKIIDSELPEKGLDGKPFLLGLIAAVESKVCKRKDKVFKSNRPHPKPGDEIEQILRGSVSESSILPAMIKEIEEVKEEDRHPWIKPKEKELDTIPITLAPPAPRIYLRAWDDRSQARIREGTEGFLSGSNYELLNTKESRKDALERHANWKNRVKTVFISTTTDFEEIANHRIPHFEKRQRKSGLSSVTKITLINGNADGMPVLQMRKELDFYKCHIPYGNSPSRLKILKKNAKIVKETYRQSLFANEHLFLFRVTANQVVKTWLWKDVKQWMEDHETGDTQRWYQEVLVPTYNVHEQARISGSVAHGQDCSCCGH